MRTLPWMLGFLCLSLLLAQDGADAGDKPRAVKAEKKWTGKVAEPPLRALAPKAGYLKDQKALDVIWADWQLKDKAPTIDFSKQLVLVFTAGGPNIPMTNYTLDAAGDLRAKSLATLLGGPGFGYSIELLNRDGIKTYQGKPIE